MSIGLHHVQMAIPAGGEKAAIRFYGELVGLERIEKPANLAKRGGVWFATATLQVHLGVDKDFVPARKAHVAFEVPNLDALRSRLEREGIGITADEPLEGFDRFYVSDPFGNRVEFLKPHPANDR